MIAAQASPFRISWLSSLLLGLGLAACPACTLNAGAPPSDSVAGGSGGQPPGTDMCVNGAIHSGCSCSTPGQVVECGQVSHRYGDHVTCSMGKITCNNGVWGTCIGDHYATKRLPGGPPGLSPQTLVEASACDDPCDPSCQQYVDTPSTIEAGLLDDSGLVIVDGGIQLQPGLCQTGCATPACGDGTVNAGEQCDDGNTKSGDGCNATCQLEPNWMCLTPGQACVANPCGDGWVKGTETCDDTNTISGDGCSASCQVEPGWVCPTPGAKCIAKQCGDGMIAGIETCDDGNASSGDGCSSTCAVEPGYTCLGTPSNCHKTTCGDGLKEGTEQCDDGNLRPYDGCSPTCEIEPSCAGGTCTAVCGDGLKFPSEPCDDGNTVSGDGCSSTCKLETGFTCQAIDQAGPAELSIPILYRDMLYSGTTGCKGNALTCSAAADCCSGVCTSYSAGGAACNNNSDCASKVCNACAGDGSNCSGNGDCCGNSCSACSKLASTVCTSNSQCCSNSCTCKANGQNCLVATDCCGGTCSGSPKKCSGASNTKHCVAGGAARGRCVGGTAGKLCVGGAATKTCTGGTSSGTGCQDFQSYCCGDQTGLVQTTLSAAGRPQFASASGFLTDATTFCWWYSDKDCAGVGTTNPYAAAVWLDSSNIPTTLKLLQQGAGNNIYRYSNINFYPLDGLGWNGPPWNITQTPNTGDDGNNHNFAFTSELHYPFTYLTSSPMATFTFDGDDDVWAFINGHLVVDLGGVHAISSASVSINAAADSGSLPAVKNGNVTIKTSSVFSQLGLVDKGMYTIDLFQAERHTTGSDYTLTLAGFVHTISQCASVCGDGKVQGNEVCDDGVNDGSYGHCQSGCTGRGPYCGDGIKNGPEQCDTGSNNVVYGGMTAGLCAPGCTFAPYCGDGITSNGEQCDAGPGNGYGACSATCTGGRYAPVYFTQDYDSVCPPSKHVQWIDAGVEAQFPTSNGTYAYIAITAQTGDSFASLSPPTPIALGSVSGPPVDQTASWTNVDLITPLQSAGLKSRNVLRLYFKLYPTADGFGSPRLVNWRARYDCPDTE